MTLSGFDTQRKKKKEGGKQKSSLYKGYTFLLTESKSKQNYFCPLNLNFEFIGNCFKWTGIFRLFRHSIKFSKENLDKHFYRIKKNLNGYDSSISRNT